MPRNRGASIGTSLIVTLYGRAQRLVDILKSNWPIVLSNLLSLYLAACCWNPYDVRYFIIWYDKYYLQGNLLYVYTGPPEEKAPYFPLAIITFVLFHSLAVRISNSEIVLHLVNKIPLLIAFNAVYYILVKKYGKKSGYFWVVTFTAYSVIMMYQFDLIIVLFLLLAIISLEKGDFKLYGLFASLATLTKQTLAITLIVPIIYLIRTKRLLELVKYIVVVTTTLSLFILPFFLQNPILFLEKTLFFHARRAPQFSIWAVPYYFAGLELDSHLPSWVQNLWLVIFAGFLLWTINKMRREAVYTFTTLLKYLIAIIAGFLAFSKVLNVPYITWLAPPLIVLSATGPCKDCKVRAKLVHAYIFLNIIVILAPMYMMFPSMVVGYPIYIPEDSSWIPADKFAIDHGIHTSFIYYIVLQIRTIPVLRDYFEVVASVSHYITGLLCILSTLILLYIVYIVLRLDSQC